ncbi:hypothetical protein MUN76_12070 [Leucobacter rhizosphaerae]|uniref:Uncharacterized protein n=1 Tax=Leucobacter rhizosphaerae TaxID=2932245 RepID=A0ABY4FU52_9MICO|nr:hypothetical protein [Leucobacter rhizosphaerae]UOQ59776.1 hypothetical protein MUN76_12070 [Leucobacter rhizosphaerae]
MNIDKHLAASNDEAIALATALLAEGKYVAVVSKQISPFAMLVNEHGDQFTTIEIDPIELIPSLEALQNYDLSGHTLDAVIVVSSTQAA